MTAWIAIRSGLGLFWRCRENVKACVMFQESVCTYHICYYVETTSKECVESTQGPFLCYMDSLGWHVGSWVAVIVLACS